MVSPSLPVPLAAQAAPFLLESSPLHSLVALSRQFQAQIAITNMHHIADCSLWYSCCCVIQDREPCSELFLTAFLLRGFVHIFWCHLSLDRLRLLPISSVHSIPFVFRISFLGGNNPFSDIILCCSHTSLDIHKLVLCLEALFLLAFLCDFHPI